MIKAVIIDDEIHAVEAIRILLEQFSEEIAVVGTANSVANGIEALVNFQPDLVFLDIELKDGIGFEVAEMTSSLKYKLIFTTAYDQYAIRAFKVRAQDYLLKPIDLPEFQQTVRRCLEELKETNPVAREAVSPFEETLRIPESDHYKLIAVADITYLQADSNYTKIVMRDGRSHLLAKTLKDFENRLDPAIFKRVHHSYIINQKEVKQMWKGSNSRVQMNDESIIPVSRARRKIL